MLWPLRLLITSRACFLVYLLFKCASPLFLLWHKHYFCCIDLCLSLSDVNRVRMSGCAATCIFKRRATSRCLGWRIELCIGSEFGPWTKPEQDAHPKPRRTSWPETLWSTPGRRVCFQRSRHLVVKLSKTVKLQLIPASLLQNTDNMLLRFSTKLSKTKYILVASKIKITFFSFHIVFTPFFLRINMAHTVEINPLNNKPY